MKRWERELEKCNSDPEYFFNNYYVIVNPKVIDPPDIRAAEFVISVMDYMDPIDPLFDRFITYWTAKTPNGHKLEFEKRTTFDIPARIRTFRMKEKQFKTIKLTTRIFGDRG